MTWSFCLVYPFSSCYLFLKSIGNELTVICEYDLDESAIRYWVVTERHDILACSHWFLAELRKGIGYDCWADINHAITARLSHSITAIRIGNFDIYQLGVMIFENWSTIYQEDLYANTLFSIFWWNWIYWKLILQAAKTVIQCM